MASRSTYRKFGTHGSNIMWSSGIRTINESATSAAANNTIYFCWLGNPRTTVTSCYARFWCLTAGATVTSADMFIGVGPPSLGCQSDIEIISFYDIRRFVATANGGSPGLKTIQFTNFTRTITPADTMWFGWHHVGAGLPTYRGTQTDDLTDGTVLTGASTNTVSFTGATVTKNVHTIVTNITSMMVLVSCYTQ